MSHPHRPVGSYRSLGYFMFLSRWLQAPLYLGLIVAQGAYVWYFMTELWHLVQNVAGDGGISETEIILGVLGLVDVVMIANLLIMVIVGGYETFVARIRLHGHPDEPTWLSHVNANVLKVKLAMAIVGISSVHLLQTFIRAPEYIREYGYGVVLWQTVIHLTFVVSAIGLSLIDRIMEEPRAARRAAALAVRREEMASPRGGEAAPAGREEERVGAG